MKHKVFALVLMTFAAPFLIDFMAVLLWGNPVIGSNYTYMRSFVATVIVGMALFTILGAFMGQEDKHNG